MIVMVNNREIFILRYNKPQQHWLSLTNIIHQVNEHIKTIMNNIWKQFLVTQTAQIKNDCVEYFGDDAKNAISEKATTLASAQSTAHILCDLSHFGLIRAFGPETEAFLQNQFCNDVRNISLEQSQLNAYCSPKGRILAFFRLFQREESYYLRLPREILEPTLKRLSMFVMRAKLTLEDASQQLMKIGFAGADAEQRLQSLCGAAPANVDECIQTNNLSIIRVPGSQPRFEIYAEAAVLQELWTQLSKDATPVGNDCWTLLDIHAGIPDIFSDTQEAFVPQMVNMQALNALSFKKGCYPGQEIVARMHYLGKLKRKMYRAHTDSDLLLKPGDSLFAEGSASGQGVGKVVQAQSHPEGGVDFLAVIEISSAEERTIRLKELDGPLLKLEKLPYIVETSS